MITRRRLRKLTTSSKTKGSQKHEKVILETSVENGIISLRKCHRVSSRVNPYCVYKDRLCTKKRVIRRKYCLAYRQGAIGIDTAEINGMNTVKDIEWDSEKTLMPIKFYIKFSKLYLSQKFVISSTFTRKFQYPSIKNISFLGKSLPA